MIQFVVRFGLIVLVIPITIALAIAFLPFSVFPEGVTNSIVDIYLKMSFIPQLFPFAVTPFLIIFGFIAPLEIALAVFIIGNRVYRMLVG